MVKKNLIHALVDQSSNTKEPLKGARVRAGRTKTLATGAKRDKSLKSQKKSARVAPYTKLNKREFVLKFVKSDAGLVWPREMKIVNSLFNIFPNDDFWQSLDLKFKLNSLCWFLSDDGRKFLNLEYKKFNFEPEKPQNFDLKNNNIEFDSKIGSTVQEPVTVREFLKLWQKKN